MGKLSGYLLLVDDDPMLQIVNKKALNEKGYKVQQAYTLTDAWTMYKKEKPKAIILDIILPDGNGFDFLRELRKSSSVPVLILTAMSASDQIAHGLKTGSDYYITKPYDRSVFLAAVESMLRRAEIVPEILECDQFKLYPAAGIALLDGKDMLLTQKEYSILQLLVQQLLVLNAEEVVSAESIYEKVWMQEMVDDRNALKQTIYKLREKLADTKYTITNMRNKGYYLEQR